MSSNLLAPIGGWHPIRERELVHGWWVDPGCGRWRLLDGTPADEAFRVTEVGIVEHSLPCGDDFGRSTVVDIDGMQQRETDVVVVVMGRSA